ncbi:unnamed protein product [Rhodiola kirilowii]
MNPDVYTAQITYLSHKATEEDLYDFFSHCGVIEAVRIIRNNGYHVGYVTFRDAYALDTALLLSGAKIIDSHVCVYPLNYYADDDGIMNGSFWQHENAGSHMTDHSDKFISSPGEAVTVAQEVVKTMVSKGYVLGKGTVVKAKAFDEYYHLSATAAAKIAELSNRVGITDKINAGLQAAKSVDQTLHVSTITMTAATFTGKAAIISGKAAATAACAAVNSSYFNKGALLVSDVLYRAAKVAADIGNRSTNK